MSGGAILIALLLHVEPTIPPTLSDREVAERAEAEFQEGLRLRQAADKARPHFRKTAEYFDELRRRGACSVTLYSNLGNAYLLAGDLPHAILSYRRGLRLAPNDRTLRERLAEARERVVYPVSGGLGRPQNDPRPSWLPHLRVEWLVLAAVVCYVLTWMALTRWLMTRRAHLLAAGIVPFLLAVALSIWLVLRSREVQDQAAHPLVVIAQDNVLLRRGDGLAFPPRYDTPVNQGVEARQLFKRDGWVQIELFGGEIGWVPREVVLVDEPSTTSVVRSP